MEMLINAHLFFTLFLFLQISSAVIKIERTIKNNENFFSIEKYRENYWTKIDLWTMIKLFVLSAVPLLNIFFGFGLALQRERFMNHILFDCMK